MSQVTSLVLVCHFADRNVVEELELTEYTEGQRFVDVTEAANAGAKGPCRKMLQHVLEATAVNGLHVSDLVKSIEQAPWHHPESVLLLVSSARFKQVVDMNEAMAQRLSALITRRQEEMQAFSERNLAGDRAALKKDSEKLLTRILKYFAGKK